MARDSKGEEIEVGDVVSVHFDVTDVFENSVKLRRLGGGSHLAVRSDFGEISIVKKVERPLAVGDKISISVVPDKGVTRTIVAFDGDKIIYRAECAGTSWHTGVSAYSCKRDPR